ncbi:MAG: EamA family transporter RarD [Candidatus Aminicenantes bacterium]
MTVSDRKRQLAGIWFAVAAYLTWGFLPLYWKLLSRVPAQQILAHRIIWSLVILSFLLSYQGRWLEFRRVFIVRRSRITFLATSVIIAMNWFIYIWAVNSGHVVDTSLGYFINPLVSVMLGVFILKERLNFWQWVSVGLAGAGVAYMTLHYGKFPWISLSLALTFGFYGLIRKTARVESLAGLAAEMSFLSPLMIAFLTVLFFKGQNAVGSSPVYIHFLLLGAGVVTALPLLWFNLGVRRIPLSTIGFLQYISPSIQLVLGVFAFGEAFTGDHAVTFGLIWAALLIYSLSRFSRMAGDH